MPLANQKVSSIEEFSEWVWEVGQHFTRKGEYETAWFRGATRESYHLVPGLYRTDGGKEKLADSELRSEFARRALPFVAERPPRDDWDWYFLMQHYRAPTRLLDWTDSALVAFYFALGSTSAPDLPRRAAVWALNPFTLNGHSEMAGPAAPDWEMLKGYLPEPYDEEAELPPDPVAIDPPLAAQRMLVQHSHFTIHGSNFLGIDERKAELGLNEDLLKAVIVLEDQDDLDYLFRHLAMLGISETSIFPDLEGLARELRMEYRLDISRNSGPG
jgi:hypothetical protein